MKDKRAKKAATALDPEAVARGQRIRAQRERLGVSQASAARQIGIKPPSLSDIELGKTVHLRGPTLDGICRVLLMTPDLVFGRAADLDDEQLGAMESELTQTLRGLSPERRLELMNFARYLRDQQRRAGDEGKNAPASAGSVQPFRRNKS